MTTSLAVVGTARHDTDTTTTRFITAAAATTAPVPIIPGPGHGRVPVPLLRDKLLPASGQVQNAASSRVYVFGNGDVAEDELHNNDDSVAMEMSDLRSRGGQTGTGRRGRARGKRKGAGSGGGRNSALSVEPVLIERDIVSGDTLQIFSLQYGCPVAELKRCNNLMNDQDFFALRKLKIPVKQHSLLTDPAEEERRRPSTAANVGEPGADRLPNGGFLGGREEDFYEEEDEDESDYDEEDGLLVRQISIRDCMRDKTTARQFLQKMDKELAQICQATQSQKRSLEEVTSTLTETRIHPLLLPYFQRRGVGGKRGGRQRTACDETTCGMTWKSVLLIVLLVSVAVPVLIGAYYVYLNHSS